MVEHHAWLLSGEAPAGTRHGKDNRQDKALPRDPARSRARSLRVVRQDHSARSPILPQRKCQSGGWLHPMQLRYGSLQYACFRCLAEAPAPDEAPALLADIDAAFKAMQTRDKSRYNSSQRYLALSSLAMLTLASIRPTLL